MFSGIGKCMKLKNIAKTMDAPAWPLDYRWVSAPVGAAYGYGTYLMLEGANSIYNGAVPKIAVDDAADYFSDPQLVTGRLIAHAAIGLLFGAMTILCAYKAARPAKTDF